MENTLKYLAADYYWPLLEELEPKLGNYALLIEPTREITNVLFKIVGENVSKSDYGPSCLIHKRHVERLKKAFEMLEYLGIIAKREASRKLKSGGRGPRYVDWAGYLDVACSTTIPAISSELCRLRLAKLYSA